MTTEAAYYDRVMVENGSPAMLELLESPWRPLYQEAALWIPSHDVVDLGCGTGRFLYELPYDSRRRLIGVDFSQRALEEAHRYLGGHAELEHCDLREWQPDPDRKGGTTYTCLEVLEHLEDDRELVCRIPPGHQLVFSVPSYESGAHLRFFRGAADAVNRYGAWLDFKRWSLIELDARKVIHLFDTVRRTDTW